jgi:hypothetical protein
VRAPMTREAIFPLGTLMFEGRQLPVPADPGAILTVSYGKNWRVPDPSFKHEPGPEIVRRFDGWFGSLWRGRRAWRQHNAAVQKAAPGPSDFAHWVAGQVSPAVQVIDIGTGAGFDLTAYVEAGHRALGLDYAVPARRAKGPVRGQLNLYELRDVLTRGALLARSRRPRALCARNLLETLDEGATDHFWTFVSMVLRGGGDLFLESTTYSRDEAAAWTAEHGGGPLRRVDPDDVKGAVERSGGEVVTFEARVGGNLTNGGEDGKVWRMACRWPGTATERTVS